MRIPAASAGGASAQAGAQSAQAAQGRRLKPGHRAPDKLSKARESRRLSCLTSQRLKMSKSRIHFTNQWQRQHRHQRH
ncbi:hypothetical protein PO124_14190 [Bacillus licheniformis]|nr:hypothetical protein [Bacillus licheniformis]